MHLDFYRRDRAERLTLELFENHANDIGLLCVKESRLFSFLQTGSVTSRERVRTREFPNIQFPNS